MLVPAILYKSEIEENFAKYLYSEDMFYYSGYLGSSFPTISSDNDGGSYQYAIVDKDKLIGYFEYRIDWYSSCAHCFGLFSFDRNNRTIGLDVFRELKRIIRDYKPHRIEWRMVGDNPVEKHYDKFCRRYNGNKVVFTDCTRDRQGNYHDDIIYEIILGKVRSTSNSYAKWKRLNQELGIYVCSNCEYRVIGTFNFCPDCGARMKGDKYD